jgi:hypothetical protein
MRVLILGEGPTDLGRTKADHSFELEGALPLLARKLIEQVDADTRIDMHGLQWKQMPRRSLAGTRRVGRSMRGFANKLWGLLGLREGRQADAIVAVVDRDGKRHKDRIEELNKGRDELRKANKPCSVGVAIEMIEAWLLADEEAIRTALNDPSIQRQPDPETLASRKENSDQNPKGRLQRLMERSLGREVPQADFPGCYAEIAKNANLAILEQRCSEGFQPFAGQVRELFGS